MNENQEKNITLEHRNTKIAIILFIIGIITGALIFGLGRFMVKHVTEKAAEITEERRLEANRISTEKIKAAEEELKVLEKEYNEQNGILKKLESEKRSIDSDMRKSDWFEKTTEKSSEISEVRNKINNIILRKNQLQNGDYTVFYNIEEPKNIKFYKSFDWIAIGVVFVITIIAIIYFLRTRMK